MILETDDDCKQFELENKEGDWILHIIPVKNIAHPVLNSPSVLFIRNIKTNKTYYFSLDHPDSYLKFSTKQFIDDVLFTNKNKKWVLDKKEFSQMLELPNLYDANFVSHINNNELFISSDYDTSAHFIIKKNSGGREGINQAIPLLKHKESFDNLADDIINLVKEYNPDKSFLWFNDLIIETLAKLESQGIYVDRKMFNKKFGINVFDNIVHSQYNVYTSTGRPSNHFNNVNYAALNATDGTRKCFRSRWGDDGKMVMIDYTAFHPRIVAQLTKYPMPVDTDIYAYLAKLYFQKENVDEFDIKNSKRLTFRQFYGGIEDKYSHIKYLANLKFFIDEQWDFFQKNGYVLTPFFKRKITDKHILDPNPNKIFNYILQAIEGEIAIPKIKEVLEYLKSKKTCAVLYIYDAILYDFHKDDGIETLDEIRKIMSFGGVFPTKTYIGETYHDLCLI